MDFQDQGKVWNKKTLLFIACVLLAVIFVDRFTTILDDLLVSTQYEDIVHSETWQQDDGTSIIRVLVYSVPTFIALIGKKQIVAANKKIVNMCVNMSLLSTICCLNIYKWYFSRKTSNLFLFV